MKSQTFRDAVASTFKARAGEWIDGLALETIGGRYAWRSRISDCRQLGMVIENRQRRRPDGSVISEYRYVPPGQVALPLEFGA